MKSAKLFLVLSLAVILLTACDLKVNVNTNGNLNKLPQVNVITNSNTNAPVNVNQAPISVTTNIDVVATVDGMISQIKDKITGLVIIASPKDLCGIDVAAFSQPSAGLLILSPFNPGSDQPIKELYILNLKDKTCKKLDSSKQLSDFGARVLSPDQTRLAVALETNEAKELTLVDLVKDTSKILVTLPDDETLNGGYGGLSDHFDIKWLDNQTISYTVYKDTVKNYDINAPSQIEEVLQVRVVKID